jgi:hypothetical protein
MIRRLRTRHWLAALLLPFLAATLACASLGGPSGAPNAALTQAAGTLSAAATQVATALAITTTLGPTPASLPTEAATNPAPTAASAATLAVTPAANGSAINPCSLITSAEAQPLVGGVAMGPGKFQNESCVFSNDANTAEVALFVLPPAQAQAFLAIYVPALEGNGITVDPAAAKKLTDDAAAGDMPAAVNDLLALTNGMAGYHIEKLDGIGSAALWSWHQVEQDQEGALFAAQPGALVAMIVFGPVTVKETDDQPRMEAIVRRVLSNLPASFTLPAAP